MKAKRDRLFKRGRPLIRPLVIEEDGKPHKDVGLMWVAYKKGAFPLFPKGMTEAQFFDYIVDYSNDVGMYVADDYNSEYEGVGPIGFLSVKTHGIKIEPHADYFPWATTRNKLRSAVSFFQMVRYQKIGSCIVYSLIDSKPLFDKVQEYGVLNYVGRIPNGDPHGRGDEYLYTIRGKK
jgi:hypothetical protein